MDDIIGEVCIYLMTRPFYVQCNFSASFQYIKLRNFFPKASAKIGVTTFIKSYSSNDCKSMVCVQYDIRGALIYVKEKNYALHNLLHSEGCPAENGRIVKENMVTCKYGPKLKELYNS